MNSQQVQDMRLMYEAVYNDELWELANEYNNTIYDEDIVEVATEYFYTYGLNEDGIDILIEKVGLDNFVEFVYDLSEDLILTEARKVSKAKKQEGSFRSRQLEKLAAQRAAAERTETEKKEPESKGADTEAKAEQPKSKKPIRDAIARRILAGMERHREATQTAGRLASETGKTLGKIASVTREAGRRAGEHVKKHGMKSLANEETEIGITGKKIPKPRTAKQQYELEKNRRKRKHLGKNVGGTQYSSDVNPYLNPRSVREEVEPDLFDAILEHLIAEGYADTNESALAIMANMSEEWRQSIVEGGFNSSGRYDVGGGRTVGPVAGAVRSLFGGNLPKGQTYVPPSPQNGTNRPPAVPSSKGDSGKLTDFGAGGGKAKLKTGMSVGQVERQGRRNKGDYSG
jgi:hypothetical protein